jgi:glucose/arabinose dehydrogenase
MARTAAHEHLLRARAGKYSVRASDATHGLCVVAATVLTIAACAQTARAAAATPTPPSSYVPIADRHPVALSAREAAAERRARASRVWSDDGTWARARSAASPAPPTVPAGFRLVPVASGFDLPTKVIFLPDGRRLVATKAGVVWTIKEGAVQPTPAIDISDHVATFNERGLLSIAISKTFTTDHRLYLLYTVESNPAEPTNCKTGTLTWVTLSGDAAVGREHTILGANRGRPCQFDASGRPIGFACGSDTARDCLGSDFWGHTVGDLRFAADNTLFVSMGDGASAGGTDIARAFRAQEIDSLNGKILHIDRDGRGLPDNPFWDGDPKSNRSRVWAYGERNPFRFTLLGSPYAANAGFLTWEEINRDAAGVNSGWPCFEGAGTRREPSYAKLQACQDLYASHPVVGPPVFAYQHAASAAISGLVRYDGTRYPREYVGRVFIADYPRRTVSTLRLHSSPSAVTFASGVGAVDLEARPGTGDISVVDLAGGTLYDILYGTGASG